MPKAVSFHADFVAGAPAGDKRLDAFCGKHLNREYRVLIQRLAYEKGLIPFIPAKRSDADA